MNEHEKSEALARCAREIAEAYGRSLDMGKEEDLEIIRERMRLHDLQWEVATLFRLDDMIDGLLASVWGAYDEQRKRGKSEPTAMVVGNAQAMLDVAQILEAMTSFPGIPLPPEGSISVGVPIGQGGFPEGEPVIVVTPPEEETEEATGEDLYPAEDGQE